MNYSSMLDRLDWDFKNGKSDLGRLDRMLLVLRRNQSPDSNDEMGEFWAYIAQKNLYIAALLIKKAERAYGVDDFCVETGRTVIREHQKELLIDNQALWRLFAEIELGTNYYICEYLKYIMGTGRLKKDLKYLQYSGNLSNSVAYLLYAATQQTQNHCKAIFSAVRGQKWALDVAAVMDKTLLSKIIDHFICEQEYTSLLGLFDLFGDFKLSEFCDKSMEEWRQCLLQQPQPAAMNLFRKIIKREGLSPKQVLEQLYSFTYWATGNRDFTINNYQYFAYALNYFPDEYDYYAEAFERDSARMPDAIPKHMLAGTVVGGATRYFNYQVIEKPFRRMIRSNPRKVPDFLRFMGPLSLYYYSPESNYRKNITWIDASGNYLGAYIDYTNFIAQEYPVDEVMWIYMNSPLKAMVDCSFLIRKLFHPEIGYVDLRNALGKYTFCGRLIKIADAAKRVSFRVSLSSASCSYQFPIHHSWASDHMKELESEFSEGDVVLFNIFSANSKGMIFAYNISKKTEPQETVARKEDAAAFIEHDH